MEKGGTVCVGLGVWGTQAGGSGKSGGRGGVGSIFRGFPPRNHSSMM